jgi:hypothetical protein
LIYTAVVAYRGILAAWYLFVDRDTRLWPRLSLSPADRDGVSTSRAVPSPVDHEGDLPVP